MYLSRAFGRWSGFLFGWSQLTVILAGSIGSMAYAFADYGVAFLGWEKSRATALAVGAIVALTLLNLLGVVFGKVIQNVLTIAKVLGVLGILVAGFGWGGEASLEPADPAPWAGFGLSMVLVLYAYGGWNDRAFVASEVRDRNRNIPLALLMGTGGIMIIYLLINAAYVWSLGFSGVRGSSAPAADVLTSAWGDGGGKAISFLVMLSALGAINGLIFTGARIHVSMGKDHSVFSWLGKWNGDSGAPVRALIAQSAMALLLVLAVGTEVGRGKMDETLKAMGFSPLPGEQTMGGFETLVAGTSPVFWSFFLMTGVSLFILRWKDRKIERPFSAPLFPLEPIVFCCTCGYMLYSSITYAGGLSMLGLALLAAGIPLYGVSRFMDSEDRVVK